MSKLEPKVTPRIGLLPTGLQIYWEQAPDHEWKSHRS